MSEPLKPCPFCEADGDEFLEAATERGSVWWVNCTNCGAVGPTAWTEARATTAWNTRVSEPLTTPMGADE